MGIEDEIQTIKMVVRSILEHQASMEMKINQLVSTHEGLKAFADRWDKATGQHERKDKENRIKDTMLIKERITDVEQGKVLSSEQLKEKLYGKRS